MSININNSKIEEVNININNDEIKETDKIQDILSIFHNYEMFETLLSNDNKKLTLVVRSDFRLSTIQILDFSDISEELINDILKYIKKYKYNLAE